MKDRGKQIVLSLILLCTAIAAARAVQEARKPATTAPAPAALDTVAFREGQRALVGQLTLFTTPAICIALDRIRRRYEKHEPVAG
jgi:hypothetical protein